MFISRRALIIIGVAVVVVVGFTVFAFLFFLSQARQAAANLTTATPAITATATKAALRPCAAGTVASIDSASSSFVVTKGAKSVTISIDGTTILRSHGKKVTLSDLAVGDQVRVVAQGTCDKTATSFAAQIVQVVPNTVSPSLTPTVSPTP